MAESLFKAAEGSARTDFYSVLLPQIEALLAGEPDMTACLGNICAALKETFGFLWIGFYIVRGEELLLGPFQGPLACTRIAYGKGVCGTSWKEKRVVLVPDVEEFPGHIACSSLSRSEMVVPFLQHGTVQMVLDVDSEQLNDFDHADEKGLTELAAIVMLHAEKHNWFG